MKLGRAMRISAIVGAFAFTFLAGAWAQTQTQQTLWKWPPSMEAVNAAPNIHHVLFENEHVRLLEVTVQPGETEPLHGHMYPSVFAFDAVQASLKNHSVEGGDLANPRVYEDSDWAQPQCRTMPVQAPHQVTDVDSFPVHFYRLEFKHMDGKGIENNWTAYKR